jgi:TorA maturation chaperone TorD
MKPQPIAFADPPDEREELARAEVYGLLAALFHAAPSAELHAQLKVAVTEAPTPGALLEQSWQQVVAAARRLTQAEVAAEYDALFQGVGRPEIFLQSSFHLSGALNDRPLVALRSDLAAIGIERDPATADTEDHLALLCESMRYLIAAADAATGSLPAQQRFFVAHLAGWVEGFALQLADHPRADFYRAVALFARDFFAVERQGFELLPG